jgi:TRAP-type C4-dicarboxylate transport system permease small subunit
VKLSRIAALLRAVMVCAVLLCALPTARVSAATTTTTAPTTEAPTGISLASQSAWVPLGGTFTMFLHLESPELAARAGAAISVTVHESASTRSAFDAARLRVRPRAPSIAEMMTTGLP